MMIKNDKELELLVLEEGYLLQADTYYSSYFTLTYNEDTKCYYNNDPLIMVYPNKVRLQIKPLDLNINPKKIILIKKYSEK